MFQNIDPNTVLLLYIALALYPVSFFTFFWKKNIGLALLIIATLILGLFMAKLDPFLNLWDEQQHALVAKNMASNPFKPMLYTDPVLPFNYQYWHQNHIWLHKQPLFLWQMAASIKLFGANVLAVRLPSIVMHALLPYIVYRIGKIIKDEKAGFIAAFLIAIANYPLEMVSGAYSTDHNDMAFMFYISWSILCWLEYQKSKETKWLIWLGITAGCAVLVKWLMGLLVYVIWFIVISIQGKMKVWLIKPYLVIIKPFLISLLVFLPWQIYCLIRFPAEWKFETQHAGSHFMNVMEGHDGDWTYHFIEGMEALYYPGLLIPFVILIIVGFAIWKIENRTHQLFIGSIIVFVYLFFTLAATKMLGFTLIAMPFVFIAFGVLMSEISTFLTVKLKNRILVPIILFILLIFPAFQLINLDKMEVTHSDEGPWFNYERKSEMSELYTITQLRESFGNEKVVIFNSNITVVGSIQIMFFTDFVAYPQIPNQQEIEIVLENDYKPVVLDRGNLSESPFNHPEITIFPVTYL